MRLKLVAFVVLSLLLLNLLPACGGGGGDKTSTPTSSQTSSIAATATPAATSTSTTTHIPANAQSGPVKIGAVSVWTGPASIAGIYFTDPILKVVEKQVKDRGGILGGRPLEIKKYDCAGTVAGSVTAATKAIVEDNVSVVVFGGIGGTDNTTIAEIACKNNAFYVSCAPIFDTPERPCMVEGTISLDSVIVSMVDVITNQLQPKPQTVAILTHEQETVQTLINAWKAGYEKEGIKTVYEQIMAPGIMDYTPYLTKIKYLEPDVLILYMATADYMGVAKQIEDIGGWGDIQVVGDPVAVTAAKAAGAVGWISVTPWYSEMDNAESQKFVQDFKNAVGKSAEMSHIYYYLSFWTAVHAIEMAGTSDDGAAIAGAARSGDLEFDTPMGMVHFNTEGRADINLTAIRIEEGGKFSPLK